MLLSALVTESWAQDRTVSGKVTDDTGESIPGANIILKGTTTGTTSDIDGNWKLSVPSDGGTLVFTFVGMAAQEVEIGSRSVVDVAMASDAKQLTEVVVTALGISREKRSLGYAVSSLDNDDLVRSGEDDIIQSLAAKAPGVQVTSSAGTPGASSKVLLRGAATLTGATQPLIIVDGIPIDNSTTQSSPRDYPFNENLQGVNNSNRAVDINPADIESVTILKGPAAAALYGERAGNGAIIYTTKRGKGEKGLGVKVSTGVEFTQVNKLPEMNDKYIAGNNGVALPLGDPGPDGLFFTADDVALGTQLSWGPEAGPGDVIYDNNDNFFETGVSYTNSIEVTGGNENTSVRLSVSDLRQSGMIPNSEFDRTTARLTLDTYLSKNVKVGGTANYIHSSQIAPQNGSNLAGIMLGLLRMPINYDSRNYINDAGFQNTYFGVYDNPFYTAYENPFTSDVNRFLGNIYLDYKISDNFNFTYRLGSDVYSDNRKSVFAISSQGDDFGGLGQINENRIGSTELYGDGILSYRGKVGEKLTVNARLGHNFRIGTSDNVFARGRMMTIPNFYNLNNTSDLYASQSESEIRSQALFGELSFDYGNWFYLSLTGRNEWSSTFELENNSFFYPSASASVVFTELFPKPDWFTFGKVRYSYAQVGISPVAYATRPLYSSPTFTDGFTNGLSVPYNGVSAFSQSDALFSSDLKPEIQVGNEVGLNLIFMDGLFEIDYTYYNQTSKDLLMYLPLPGSSGYTSSYTNAGELVNKGHEIALGINPIRTNDFDWTIGLNWSKNISEVTKLAEGVEEVSIESAFASIGSFAIVGEPLGVFYGTKWERDDAGNKLIGANGRPIISPESGNVGNPLPDWLAGIRNTITYKNLSFSFLLDIRRGGSIWNGTYARINQYGGTAESEDRERNYLVEGVYAPGTVVDGVDVSGQTNATEITANTYYRFVVGDAGGAAEEFVEEVNWFRVRDMSLSYTFDLKDSKLGVNYLKLTAAGRNLFLDTNYKGVDPESSLTGAGSNINGLDYFNNPGSKSYLFTLSLGF
ncbi:SusC/RagA family TonB-linked outer membrane protein [Reichenbachiella agarivorans]|uniref:SusC/RagA family TonB-linked outer membrane protein n=2 Tax=Reichenbachiella agarivorans TaxID=2979464 RepID=A0ABY6CUE8_9BACT|nr:SusC/RagA family TonB-linked outer membrane protein [Reichenbachiella agarivorans]